MVVDCADATATIAVLTQVDGGLEVGEKIRLQSRVHLCLSSLPAMDLLEEVAETILSVLELPPFGMLEVDSRFRNAVQGRLRFKPVYAVTPGSREEGLLDLSGPAFRTVSSRCRQLLQSLSALSARATARAKMLASKAKAAAPAKPAKPAKSWYDTRGVFDEDSDDNDRQLPSAASSSYDPCKFDLLLSDLLLLLRRPKDEVTLELFLLQKGGFIEYSLSEPSICLNVLEPTSALRLQQGQGTCLASFCHEVALKVLLELDRIENSSVKRIFDMWRVGAFIDKAAAIDKDAPTSVSRDKYGQIFASCGDFDFEESGMKGGDFEADFEDSSRHQSTIRNMLSSYMDHDGDSTVQFMFASSISASSSSSKSSPDNLESLSSTPIPLVYQALVLRDVVFSLESFSDVRFTEPNAAQREIETLRREILALNQDIRLTLIVKRIVSQIAYSPPDDRKYFMQLKALYFAKVFHGLGSGLLPAAEWREQSGSWKKFNHILFGFLVNLGYNVLLASDERAVGAGRHSY